MAEDLRQELVDIKDNLTDIIPKLEAVWLDHASVSELNEAKIIVGWKIKEIDLME